MKIARYLSLLIVLMLCLFIGAAGAETTSATTTYTVDAETLGLPSNDELFAYYVEQQMFGYEWVTWGTAAREQLSVQQKLVYDVLKAKIEDVAAYGGSTNFVFAPSNIPGFDNTFTLTELGVSAFFETVNGQTSFTAEAAAALDKAIFGSVFDALVFDCPMDLYWFDKAVSNAMQQGYSASSSGDTLTINQLIITMQVARAYQGANTTVVKPSNLDTVLANAEAVVAANKDKSAPEMLKAFKEYICNAVSYNEDAAADDYNGGYGDPWQLIYVFDGDSSTNVVCEGYAKAFQYLCDIAQSEYNVLQDISVITVTGYMSGGTGAGPHMWNVVNMDDGENYIVDVTNSEVGTVGEDGELFLGGTSDTTPHWIVDKSDGSSWGGIYVFKYGTGNNDYVQYNYDNPLPYSDKELALAPYNYTNVAYVADVNGTKYEVFSHALNAWMGSGTTTLTLLKDIELTEVIKLDTYYGNKVLDLNGHQLSRTDGSIVLYITNGSVNLTIQDSAGNGKIVATADRANLIDSTGKLTITGGTFEAGNGIAIANYGTLHISGNTVISNTSENFACVLYPTSISGNVQINANIDIGIKYTPDLKNATNCRGWVVKNSGDNTATLYAGEWLPNGYALQINSTIDYELDEDATGTIVEHNTCTAGGWGSDEEGHWKLCACGRLMVSGAHTLETYANNGDGTHDVVCECGYVMQDNVPHDHVNGVCLCGAALVVDVADVDGVKFANFADALAAWMNPEAKTLTLLANVETTTTINVEEVTKVLDLNGFVLIDARNEIAPTMNVYSDLTIMNTSNSGTGVIKKTDFDGGAIWIRGGSTLKIVGDVKITAGYAIEYAGDVDLSEATSCIGWIVWHAGGTLTLPANTALKLYSSDKLVHELRDFETATIVAHPHSYTNNGHDETNHWKVCACGATSDEKPHRYEYVNNNDGKTHKASCDCGYTKSNVNHDLTTGECPCGAKAVASVTISGTTTYHGTLNDALTAANRKTATVTLLADCEINSKVIFDYSSSNVTLELNGKTITSSAELDVDLNAKLSIEGSGTFISGNDQIALIYVQGSLNISGGNFTTTGEDSCSIAAGLSGKVKISGNPTFSSSDGSEFSIHANAVLDLRNATPPTSNGWRVQCWDPNGMAVDTNLILPNGYALQNADGNIVTRLGKEEVGTIVKHDEHTYVDGKCGCGEVCDHGFILPDGTCDYCKLHFVADVSINNAPATPYATLKDALNAAKGQTATICLLADCVLDEPFSFTSGSNVTLELNDKTITGTASNSSKLAGPLSVDTGATLTIKGTGKYTYTNNGYAGIAVEGKLNIQSGTFEVTKGQARVLHAKTGGEINISGGTFIVSNTTSQHVHTDGVVNISRNPQFTGLADETTANEFSIGKGTLNLAGVTGNVVEGLRVRSCDNGVEVGPKANIILPDNYVLQDADGNIVTSLDDEEKGIIVKHTHAAKNYADNGDESHRVTCACGEELESMESHTYTEANREWKCLCGAKAEVEIDGTKLRNFKRMMPAWAGDPSITRMTLLVDVETTEHIGVGSEEEDQKVLDLNGFVWSFTSNEPYPMLNVHSDLMIMDTSDLGTGKLCHKNQQDAAIVAYEGSKLKIVGDVKIDAPIAICFAGAVDLSEATSCIGWIVKHEGGTLTLPADTALRVGDKLVQKLEHYQTATIVKHTHDYTTYGYDENNHWKVCACGATGSVVDHGFEYVDNQDGKTHKASCDCGYEKGENHDLTTGECPCGAKAVADVDGVKFGNFDDAVAAWQVSTAKKLTLLANVKTGYIELTTDNGTQKVLELNGWQLKLTTRTALTNHISLTIQDSSETGTGSLYNNLPHATLVTNHGELNITGGTFEVPASGAYVIVNKGTLCISGVTKLKNKIFSSAVIAEGPTTISGNVQIEADTAIRCNGAVDVSGANNCVGWTVTNYGGTLKLPADTALETESGDLVYGLSEETLGNYLTIVEHTHAAKNYADNEDGTHKVTCACGYVLGSNAPHTYTEVDRVWECPCGAIAVADVDGKKYTDFEDAVYAWLQNSAKNLTLLADVETTKDIGVGTGEEDQKVLDLNGFVWSLAYDDSLPMMSVYSDLTIMDTSNLGTGKLWHKDQQGGAIDVYEGKLKIVGDVQITAGYAIYYVGDVDLIEATSCIDWIVAYAGGTLTLPANTALQLDNDKLVQELRDFGTATIVQHNHSYTTYGHDEYKHWKVCECGATDGVVTHNYTDANNETHHWTACTCGVTTAQVAHGFKYVDNQDGKTHKVSCDCGYEKASVNHDVSTGECVCGAKAVADVDDSKFANFADAVTAWEAPTATKLTLLDNVEYGDVISLKPDEAKTLDLNGKTLTSTTSANFALYTACPLTINDSSTDRTGKFVADDIGECVVYCHGQTLTLNGGTITTNRASFVLELNGNITTINSDNVKLSSNLAAIKVLNISNLTISGNGCDGWKIWNDSAKPSPIQIPDGFHLEDEAGNMLETNDKLPSEKYTVIKVDHIHNWTYAANDTADTITATCDAAGCPKPQQSMTLVAPVNLVYDGTAKTVTIDGSIEGVQMPSINITGDTTNVTEEGCTATITVAGVTATLSFKITPASIVEATVSAEEQTYTGAAITPEVTVTLDGKTLTLNTDYTVAYADNVNVGKATITVTGKGNYTETATGEFNIKAASIESAQITVADQVYTGEALEPAVTVTLGSKNLTLNTDYTVAYEGNVNVGTAKVTINGKGNYNGTVEGTFTISQSGAALTAEAKAEYTYGDKITVTGTITATGEVPEQQSNKLRVVAPRVTLFYGETELGSAVLNGNAYTVEYNTMDKLLPIDTHTLTVEYSGDMNMAKSSTTVDVTLKAAELIITGAETASRDYDTTNVVEVTDVTLNGILTGDEVSADVTGLTGTISSAYVGAYDNIILPALSLMGEDAAYYMLKQPEDAVATTVTISPKEVEASIELDEDTFVYDGNAKEPAVTAAKDGAHVIPATEYTVSYNNNTDVGTATVTLTDAEGGNYSVTGSKEFTITTSGAALTAEAEAEYTYGDKITVTGTITATGEAPEQQSNKLRVVAPRVTLFYGETVLGSAVVNGNAYTIEYNTMDKLLPIGTNPLTVEYSGSKNLADATATVTVTLVKAAPEYTVPADLEAVYGQTLANVTLPRGWSWNQSTNAVGSVGVNSHKATFTPEDTDFYTTAEEELAVTVKPLPITGVTGPETQQLDVFCPTVEDIIAQLPKTLPGTGSDGQTYDIPVEWSFDGDEFNDDPDAENTFTWTAQSGDPFEIPEDAAGITVVKNGSAMEVTITGENKSITYDGSTYDVSEMFIIDTNAGTAAYAITGGDGTGTLEGSVLTITKAGTFTIQVTTQTNVKDGMPYAPGEATAILTVSKGVPAYTVPTGLTATYGQTLQEISLNGFAGWTWKETTTKVGDAGDNTHTAVFTPENTDLWNTAEADVIITVAKADIQLAGVVKTFLVTEEGETETAVYTYGDTITVKATPVMPVMMALADEMAMPQPNQMALYCGSKQISAPADAVEGLYTLTYQTTDKALAAGENEILVKYIGTDNLNSGMMSLNVTINPAELSIADVDVKNRPYMQGNLFVEVTKVDLAGKKLDTDDVAADLIGLQASVESDAVGKYAEVVLAEKINLKGADASFYTVKGGVAIKLPEGTEGEITKAKLEPEGTPDMGNVAPGNQLGDVPTDPIEDLFDVPGNVTWNDPADTPVEPGKEYEWTFTPEDDENYEPVTGSTVLVPVAPPQPPVPPSEPVDLPQIIWPTQDQFVTLNNGDTVTMPVSAINADRYQWFVNRNDGTGYVPVSGANTASLTITVNDKDNGNVYLCRVGNANGTVMSPVFHLEVLPAVDVPPTGDTVNTMLWAALLMLSAAGLLLVRKIKVNLG